MSNELLPCPFCGGKSRMSLSGAPVCYVVCSLCTTCGPVASTSDDAIERWNRRHQPVTPAGGEVEPVAWILAYPDGSISPIAAVYRVKVNAEQHIAGYGGTLGLVPAPLYTHPPVADAALVSMDKVLRDSVPDRWKACTSPVGAAQSYIAELEQAVLALSPEPGIDEAIDAALNQRGAK